MKYILEDEAIHDNGCFATGGIGSSIGCQRSQLSHYEEIIDEPRRCLRKIHGVTWLGHVLQYRDRTKCITHESFFCDFSIRRGGGGCTCILSLHAVQEEDNMGWDVFLSDT